MVMEQATARGVITTIVNMNTSLDWDDDILKVKPITTTTNDGVIDNSIVVVTSVVVTTMQHSIVTKQPLLQGLIINTVTSEDQDIHFDIDFSIVKGVASAITMGIIVVDTAAASDRVTSSISHSFDHIIPFDFTSYDYDDSKQACSKYLIMDKHFIHFVRSIILQVQCSTAKVAQLIGQIPEQADLWLYQFEVTVEYQILVEVLVLLQELLFFLQQFL